MLSIIKNIISSNGHQNIKIDQLNKILSVETLTIIQFIGFNYKQSIDAPLILLLREFIELQIPMDSNLNIDYVLAMVNLAQDKEAVERYCQQVRKSILKKRLVVDNY